MRPRALVAIINKIMNHKAVSIRPFIGAKNFEISRSFYQDLGFQEAILGNNFSYFHTEGIGFYLQDAYVKNWIMIKYFSIWGAFFIFKSVPVKKLGQKITHKHLIIKYLWV
jgi:hypothetical protein